MNARQKILALGEALWDIFPDGKKLGGAALNFAAHARSLGADSVLVSRVGADVEGAEILRAAAGLGLPPEHIQRDATHPTGRVLVTLDRQDHPRFEIVGDVAWDYIAENAAARALARMADAICFGTLAQRRPVSRETIQSLVTAGEKARYIVCDLNFRQQYYSREVVAASMRLANVVKLNETELPILCRLLDAPEDDAGVAKLIRDYDLRLMCVTLGARGCWFHDGRARRLVPGYVVKVVDTVGAGDAFTAGLTVQLLAGADAEDAADFANRVGAYVASRAGGAPLLDLEVIKALPRRPGPR